MRLLSPLGQWRFISSRPGIQPIIPSCGMSRSAPGGASESNKNWGFTIDTEGRECLGCMMQSRYALRASKTFGGLLCAEMAFLAITYWSHSAPNSMISVALQLSAVLLILTVTFLARWGLGSFYCSLLCAWNAHLNWILLGTNGARFPCLWFGTPYSGSKALHANYLMCPWYVHDFRVKTRRFDSIGDDAEKFVWYCDFSILLLALWMNL